MERWETIANDDHSIVFRNKKNPELTVEAHWLDSEEEGAENQWYGFSAVNGKSVPFSPEMFENRKEAKEWLEKIKEMKKKDLEDKENFFRKVDRHIENEKRNLSKVV
jgi:hypothetical protein